MATYTGTLDGASIGATPAVKGTSPSGVDIPPVQGFANSAANGVFGQSGANYYGAVAGVSTATYGYGVYGEANGVGAYGVYGKNTNTGVGVYGTNSGAGQGVRGTNSGAGHGVYGDNTGGGHGVLGSSSASTGAGVAGTNSSTGYGVYGISSSTGYGVYGINSSTGYGVYGDNSGAGYGVYGNNSGTGIGVYGVGFTGVKAVASASGSAGIHAAIGSGLYAGFFTGLTYINGNFTVPAQFTKSFVGDHPLDPENKVLLHACVESPERKNVYDGVGVADSAGELVVQLPAYFEALNSDFRYQLTAIGKSAPGLHVKQKVSHNQFIIAGAAPGQEVCWLVTGNRSDPASKLYPFVPEQEKRAEERGFYHCPEAYGKPKEKGIEAKYFPDARSLTSPHPMPVTVDRP